MLAMILSAVYVNQKMELAYAPDLIRTKRCLGSSQRDKYTILLLVTGDLNV